jgi:hypothetical protein
VHPRLAHALQLFVNAFGHDSPLARVFRLD